MKYFLVLTLMCGGIAVGQDATLYIVNDSKGGGFAMRPLTLKVLDGRRELTSVKNHQTVKVNIMPGVHGLSLKIADKDITVLTAKPGETYFLRISVDQGLAYASTHCILMKPQEAAYWIPQAQLFVNDTTVTPVTSDLASVPVPTALSPAVAEATLREPQSAIIDSNVDSHQSLGEVARAQKKNLQNIQAVPHPSVPLPAAPTTIFGITLGRPLPVLPTCFDDRPRLPGTGGEVGVPPSGPEPPCATKMGDVKVSESKASFIRPEKVGDNVEQISAIWSRQDFCEQTRARLEVKFGRPTTEVEQKAITGAGVQVPQIKAYWILKDSTALFLAPFSEVNDCWLLVSTPVWEQAHPAKGVDF